MNRAQPSDSWNQGGPYDRYVGRWSLLVAREFVDWLNLPSSLRWLDVGCGTGALTTTILDQCRPARLVAIDPSEGFVATARARLDDRATFHVANAFEVPLGTAEMDVAVSGLVLNFVPDPVRGLTEMRRTTVQGGTIAAYVWDYAGKMELMRHFWDAAVEFDDSARALDEGGRFPLCNPEALETAFRNANLSEIKVAPISIPTRFRDFDDYWSPFLGGQGPAPSYAMSLDDDSRSRLRDRLRERLPADADGGIPLVARAWAVRGQVPG